MVNTKADAFISNNIYVCLPFSSSSRRRGRTGRSTRSTWIVQGHPNWDHDFRQGISMVVAESAQDYQVFKYVHSQAFQQTQFKFLEAVESQNTRNIVVSEKLLSTYYY